MKETRFAGTIVARTATGQEVLVEVFKTRIIGEIDPAVANQGESLGYLKMKDGRHVKYVSKGKYQIVDTSATDIASDDPTAP